MPAREEVPMADEITFDCPSCKQYLEAPADMAGEWIECPECGTRIEVRDPNRTIGLRLASDPRERDRGKAERRLPAIGEATAKEPHGERNREKVERLPDIGGGTGKEPIRSFRVVDAANLKEDFKATSIVGKALALILIGGFIWAIFPRGLDDFDPKLEHMKDGRLMAWIICEEEVEKRLRAPRTVKWPPMRDRGVTYTGNGVYRISSYCDAQNAFGALVRSEFQAVIYMEGENYRVDSLTLDQ